MNKRLISLDVFRGMTIMLMILVNNPGSWSYVYPPLRHADWHGCTPTDLVFPFFMFIIGVSVGFSIRKYDLPNNLFLVKAVKRGLIIILIGYLLRLFPFTDINLSTARILGVLQRIGLAYIFAAILINYFKKINLIIISAAILLGYWALLYFGSDSPYSLENSIVRKFDLAILGADKLWHGKGLPFDPEGLLSTIPAIVSILVGYFTSIEIIQKKSRITLVKRLLLGGLFGIILGWLWGQFFPINKSLWTSSYVIYTSGFALMILGVLLYIIDVLEYKKWTKIFVAFGTNPLFIFVLSGLWTKTILKLHWGDTNGYTGLFKNVFQPIAGDMNGSLLFAITHIIFFGIIAWILYKKKIIIKV